MIIPRPRIGHTVPLFSKYMSHLTPLHLKALLLSFPIPSRQLCIYRSPLAFDILIVAVSLFPLFSLFRARRSRARRIRSSFWDGVALRSRSCSQPCVSAGRVANLVLTGAFRVSSGVADLRADSSGLRKSAAKGGKTRFGRVQPGKRPLQQPASLSHGGLAPLRRLCDQLSNNKIYAASSATSSFLRSMTPLPELDPPR